MEHPWRLTPAALPAWSSGWPPSATTGSSTASTQWAAPTTAAGFRMLELDRFDFQIMPPLVRPHVLGVAQRPTHPGFAEQAER